MSYLVNDGIAQSNSVVEERSNAIVYWALAGCVCCVFSASVFGQWILSDTHFSTVPITAADAVSDAQILRIRIVEILSSLVALAALGFYCLRPVLKGKSILMEGLLLFGAIVSYVLDTSINYFDYYMAWNKHGINWGTWGAFFPGHSGPTNYAESLFWGVPMYLYFGVALASIQLFVVKHLRNVVNCGFMVALLCSFPVVFLFDLVAESTIIRTGAYSFPNTIGALTVWKGSQFQFPLYESFMVGIYVSMYSMLMHYRDANGLTIIERGLDRFSSGAKFPLRFFAACAFSMLCTGVYFGGFNLFAMFSDNLITLPEYMMYGR
jgi:hypothetical protein